MGFSAPLARRMPPEKMRLPPEIQQFVLSRAEAVYPSECCGLISKSEDASSRLNVWPIRNIQDEMHQADPREFPRTSRDAYWMAPVELLTAQKQMRQQGGRLFIIYHSHPDGKAFFSAEDERLALDDRGEPLYDEVLYWVIPVIKGKAGEGSFFKWNSESKKFNGVNG